MVRNGFVAAAWLMASLSLTGCRGETKISRAIWKYDCEQGHTHKEVVPAKQLPDGSVIFSLPAGKQIECLPKGR